MILFWKYFGKILINNLLSETRPSLTQASLEEANELLLLYFYHVLANFPWPTFVSMYAFDRGKVPT